MTASAPPVGFCHEALLYSSAAEFVAATTSFLRAGVAADDAMMVAVDRSKIDLLRGELGGDADAISFVDMAEIGRNPATIIPAWRDFVDAHADGARGLRGIGEPVWPARTADELSECHQHEALLNLAFDAAVPFRLLCPYDAATLGPSALETAWRTHPLIATASGTRASEQFDGDVLLTYAVRLAAAQPAGRTPPRWRSTGAALGLPRLRRSARHGTLRRPRRRPRRRDQRDHDEQRALRRRGGRAAALARGRNARLRDRRPRPHQ